MSVGNRWSLVVSLFLTFFLPLSALAEMGEGIVQDPVTGKLTLHVYKDWIQGIVLDPQTGNYIITYKDGYGFFDSSVFEPATKITPNLTARFHITDQDGLIEYRYTLSNVRTSKQGIEGFRVLVSSVAPGNSMKAGNWEGVVAPTVTDSNFFLSWLCSEGDNPCSLPPGRRQEGLRVTSRDLPGVSVAEIRGKTTFNTRLVAERNTSPTLEQQINDLTSFKDFVPRNVAAPLIPVPNPFDAAAVLTSMQKHVNQDLVGMKLIDPTFASQLDRLFQAAVDAAKGGNTVALKSDIKDLRRMLKREHADVDKDDEDWDRDDNGKDKEKDKSRQIDKLAARVLDFDLKYIQKRLGHDD